MDSFISRVWKDLCKMIVQSMMGNEDIILLWDIMEIFMGDMWIYCRVGQVKVFGFDVDFVDLCQVG